jgi:hypothetical protein
VFLQFSLKSLTGLLSAKAFILGIPPSGNIHRENLIVVVYLMLDLNFVKEREFLKGERRKRTPSDNHRTVTLSRRIDRYRFLILSVKKVPVDCALNRLAKMWEGTF